jgi:asparagine synthetase B (glutamine-hydrolysing)
MTKILMTVKDDHVRHLRPHALSINDVTGGHQPIANEDGKVVTALNGWYETTMVPS